MEKLNTKRILNNQGVGLVEAVIAITFAVVVIVTLLAIINFNLQNSAALDIRQNAVKDQVATLETLKVKKEQGYNVLVACPNGIVCSCGDRDCSLSGSEVQVSCDTVAREIITCFRATTNPDRNINLVNLNFVTYFKIRGNLFSTPLSTVITNWRNN